MTWHSPLINTGNLPSSPSVANLLAFLWTPNIIRLIFWFKVSILNVSQYDIILSQLLKDFFVMINGSQDSQLYRPILLTNWSNIWKALSVDIRLCLYIKLLIENHERLDFKNSSVAPCDAEPEGVNLTPKFVYSLTTFLLKKCLESPEITRIFCNPPLTVRCT